MITSNILLGPGGWYVEWYDEETEMVAYWYAGRDGGRAECEERIKGPLPDVWSTPTEGAGPYDAATATGMYNP